MNWLSEIRKVFWPIEWHENKKFLPMVIMMFCILLNYSTLRSLKDSFVVMLIGEESISFLKLGLVTLAAIIATIAYVKLCNTFKQESVFYIVTWFFIAYFLLFTFILYPYQDLIHPSPEKIDILLEKTAKYPFLKWPIKIAGKWSLATFYVMAELWGSMMLSLLFWQFANQITKTEEAKRFFSMFGMLGNVALPCTGLILGYFLSEGVQVYIKQISTKYLKLTPFTPIMLIISVSCVIIMVMYRLMNKYVLTDPSLYDQAADTGKIKKGKIKLSIIESFKVIFTSKYLGLIALLVLGYGISINLVEIVWKAKLKGLYSTAEDYARYMGKFQAWQGTATILFMILGSNILRKLSWFTSAVITPVMILVTSIIFFTFIFFDNVFAMYFVFEPLVVAATVGTIQNVLSKATKYSLFDATKNMAYIPIDQDTRVRGQAAVEVVGGRFGKSGGSFIQMLFYSFGYNVSRASPYFAVISFVVVILWIYAVKSLNKEYQTRISHT
ncbi:AAA family ATPase [Wolbachia pipientis]|uniref:ADP,ATP carrier protein n=1 Tax=Wolbachia pipientis TaxID=955 RepID=A0A1E7QIY4_WOLPI|nr:Npt1/Npt2 family nucleotide transporter [Wolbachia pipientis]OEY86433.1 AAA family ATPase [Wolbachia pipientis]